MKLITWNVAGFRKAKSLGTWDYSEIDFDYFVNEVKKFDPDIVCLQEVLIGEIDQVKVFSEKIGFGFYTSVKMSPDHTGTNDWVGLGIISKIKIENIKTVVLPYPDFPLIFADGREAQKFDKLMLVAQMGNGVVATTQLQPIHYWGYNYSEEPALSYAKNVSEAIVQSLGVNTIIAGDFQISDLSTPLSKIYNDLRLKDGLPDEFTRMRENGKHTKSDHVLIPIEANVLRSQVIKTMTDHFMCFVELE